MNVAINHAALQASDRYCDELVRHYENFTVASHLAPRRLRRDLTRVYAFCRTTDDIGDETGDPVLATQRLEHWRSDVESLFAGALPVHPVLVALAPTARAHLLPAKPLLDLIQANLQDQRVDRYEDWQALRDYCRLSAAPVGRLVLQLFGMTDPGTHALSDDVCIGLQLANFAQDVSIDARRGRTYLLQCEMRDLGPRGAVRAMCDRAAALLSSGRALEATVHGRLRTQLALYRLGGEAILHAVAAAGHDTAHTTPVVAGAARWRILLDALRATAPWTPAVIDPAELSVPGDG